MPNAVADASHVNDFVVKFANVNGTGSASANSLIMKAIFRMGVPVTGKNYFPVQHPGSAHLVRDPRHPRRLRGACHAGRHHGRHECRDLFQGRARGEVGRVSGL